MRKVLMMFATLSLLGCAAKTPIVSTPLAACGDLIPASYADGVQGAPIPDNAPIAYGVPLTPDLAAAIVNPWAAAYVAASGQLEKANGRTADVIKIVKDCEARTNAARADAKR